MVKNQLVRIGIVIGDIGQPDLPRDREFLLCDDRIGNICVRLVRLLDKIVTHIKEKRLIKRHTCNLVIDAARRRQQTHCRDAKRRKQRHHCGHVRTQHNQRHDIAEQPRHTHGLDQKLWRVIKQTKPLHRPHISFSNLAVLTNKVLLAPCDLDLLDALHRLGNPCKHRRAKILILFAGAVHDRLHNLLDDNQRRNQKRRNDHRHYGVLHRERNHQKQRDNHLRGDLQDSHNQRIHIADIRRDTALNDRRLRVQIIFILAPYKVFHQTRRRLELVAVHKPVQTPLKYKLKAVLRNI